MDRLPASASRFLHSSVFAIGRTSRTRSRTELSRGNGRIEGKLVDVAGREPLRVKEVLVDEGALVRPGQVLVRLDTVTLEAELAEAKAAIDAAQEKLAVSKAAIIKAGERDQACRDRGGPRREARQSRRPRPSASSTSAIRGSRRPKATLGEARAMLQSATQQVEVARANAATIQTRIDDATLKSPVTGRVLYRLTEVGEVLAPGGRALTLVNLEDIYMEIFLPSDEAANVKNRRRGTESPSTTTPSMRWQGASASFPRKRSSRPSRSRRSPSARS